MYDPFRSQDRRMRNNTERWNSLMGILLSCPREKEVFIISVIDALNLEKKQIEREDMFE
jgi:hypothetical protein